MNVDLDRDVFFGSPADFRAWCRDAPVAPLDTLPAPPPDDIGWRPIESADITGDTAAALASLHLIDDEEPDTDPATPTSKSSQRLEAVRAPILGVK